MTVLAAVDVRSGPEKPINIGYELATAFNETFVVLYVMPQEEYDQQQGRPDELPSEFQEFTLENAMVVAANKVDEVLNEVLGSYDHDTVESIGRIGSPEKEILKMVEELSPRFVVVGGRKRSPVKKAVFGSVSQEIILQAEPPVVALMEE